MNKMYVLEGLDKYAECTTVIGVFTTEEMAQAAITRNKQKGAAKSGVDHYIINVVDVDRIYDIVENEVKDIEQRTIE